MTKGARRAGAGAGSGFGVVAVVAVATGIGWLMGMPWARALVLAVPIGAAVVLVRYLDIGAGGDAAWPRPPAPPLTSAGWHQVALLGSTLHAATGDVERFNSVVGPRLRRLADLRLREAGLRWDDPAARHRLGAEVHDLLTLPASRPPAMGGLQRAIERIEALGSDTPR
jgi:hypothetical protein